MVALNFKAQNIGIDLGTANTIVYLEDEGIVTREPSVVAKNIVTEEIIAVGKSAFEMIGRTPENIVALRPMKDGVIADYNTTTVHLNPEELFLHIWNVEIFHSVDYGTFIL